MPNDVVDATDLSREKHRRYSFMNPISQVCRIDRPEVLSHI